ncbi:hypothetical protein EIN_476010 [Entamoeba invadens IP1]|uniref:TNFR-Cys domain-containing protein n=1 Tax=Entamoeba invadens IP1 TaxID=370355 RepID=A0A0A1U3U5_ENTIV|nr:hypothetical protein EIN_476010 [Entamoeba invadens IP1]ELP88899.1 hypothetical protein EIN_476010 [Entamoeba invadens IP1]|eukprot:XP_004255670.1 hypothetical protein EIN_476010 [Entamoeba invadens IP1]
MHLLLNLIAVATSLIANCKTQMSDTQCLICDEGYYLKLQEDGSDIVPSLDCAKIEEDLFCEKRLGDECVLCSEGYFVHLGQCQKCPMENCLYCNLTQCFKFTLVQRHSKCLGL